MNKLDGWLSGNERKGPRAPRADARAYLRGRALSVVLGGRADIARRVVAGHLLITGKRVIGASVFGIDDARLGKVLDVSIEKTSGHIRYVLLVVGGFLGLGGRVHPIPWSDFKYETGRGGYRLPYDRTQIAAMTGLSRDELEWCGAGDAALRQGEVFNNAYLGPPPY